MRLKSGENNEINPAWDWYESLTGKSFLEVLIYSSINPKYDNGLFNDLQVQYEKITRAEHVKNMLFTKIV